MNGFEFIKRYNEAAYKAGMDLHIDFIDKAAAKATEGNIVIPGGPISFMVYLEKDNIVDITLMDTVAGNRLPKQEGRFLVLSALLLDVIVGLPQKTRNFALNRLGLNNGKFIHGKTVALTKQYNAKVELMGKEYILFQILTRR